MTNSFGKNPFTGIPVEYTIPKSAEVVFVNDFFVKEVSGGAELTSEAIIAKSPHKVFKLHSASLNKRLLDANKNKYWVFGNFASLPQGMVVQITNSGIRYSIIEYDFKFCAYRSTNRHQQATGHLCNCAKDLHGLNVTRFFKKAEKIFWMSSGQKAHWLKNVPELEEHPGHVVLSSVFSDETLNQLAELRKTRENTKPVSARLGSGSWIKGVEETEKWCNLKKVPSESVPSLPYQEFLKKLSEYQGFVFMPLDKDTCPRVTIEARLLGLKITLNKNVLQQNEEWFAESADACDEYMRTRGAAFWKEIQLTSP